MFFIETVVVAIFDEGIVDDNIAANIVIIVFEMVIFFNVA